MAEQIVCSYPRKKGLEKIRDIHRFKSMDQVLGLFLNLYEKEYPQGNSVLIEELNIIKKKYGFLLSKTDNIILEFLPPLLRADDEKRIEIAKALSKRIEEDCSLLQSKEAKNGNEGTDTT